MKRLIVAAAASLGFCFMSGAASAGSVASPNGVAVERSLPPSGDITLVKMGGRNMGGMSMGGRHMGGGGGGGYRNRGGWGRGYGGAFFFGAPFAYGAYDDGYYSGGYYGGGYGYGACYARCRRFRGPYFCRYNAGRFC